MIFVFRFFSLVVCPEDFKSPDIGVRRLCDGIKVVCGESGDGANALVGVIERAAGRVVGRAGCE